jgi:hypothetical protein
MAIPRQQLRTIHQWMVRSCTISKLMRISVCRLLVVVEQAENVVLGEAFAALQKVQLNGEG